MYSTTICVFLWLMVTRFAERDQLNERPIILRSTFLNLAVCQSFLHLYYDYGRVKIHAPSVPNSDARLIQPPPAEQILKQKGPQRFLKTFIYSVGGTLASLLLYAIFLRQTAFQWSLWFARLVWDVPRSSEPSTIPPFHYTLLVRAFDTGFLLMLLWELSNLAFSAYVCQPPVKRGKPVTFESRDPNTSLLNGLKSKKSLVKTFAFWELDMISNSDEARRKTIYSEYDRKDSSTWSQTLQACLDVVDGISTRLTHVQVPPPEMTLKGKEEHTVASLPRLSAPLKADPIFAPSPKPTNGRERIEANVDWLAKSVGQSPSNGSGVLRKGVRLARDKALSSEYRQALETENIESAAKNIFTQALASPVGFIFQQTFDRRAKAKVCGTPRSELEIILFAVDSVAWLAVNAIKEDSMGLVNKDVALIMRTFGNIIAQIKKSMRESPVHWTDVKFQSDQSSSRSVQEIDLLLEQLQTALKLIIEGYGKFARDMSLSPEEMKAARMAAGLSSS